MYLDAKGWKLKEVYSVLSTVQCFTVLQHLCLQAVTFLKLLSIWRLPVTSHIYRNTALIQYQIKIKLQKTTCNYMEQKTLESRDTLIATYMDPFHFSV